MSIVIKRPAVLDDLDDAAAYLGARNPQAAAKFLLAAEETFRNLAGMPQLGAVWETFHPHLSGLRQWRVKGFENHLIFYVPMENGITVVRVLYASRDVDASLGGA